MGIKVVEHTWDEPLPPGDQAWSGLLQSTVGAAVRTLPPPQQQLARERFLADLRAHRATSRTDAQLLYVGTATKP